MAARTVAAAISSAFIVIFLVLFTYFPSVHSLPDLRYSSQELRDILQQKDDFFHGSSEDFHREHNIHEEIARSPGSTWTVVGAGKRRRRRRERKQKRGCRSGVIARLKKDPHRPALPSMFVTNARSMTNKMDEMHLLMERNRHVRDCCVSVITETWLNPRIPDEAAQLAGRSLYRWDRNQDSGKSRGGGLCVYVHNGWSTHNVITHTHCSPDIEYICVKARPFYLPRELTAVLITAVYIPPDAHISTALALLSDTINTLQRSHPDGVHIIAGDFNQADLKTVLPRFYQQVKCPTRGANTLDHVYTNIKYAYRASQLPHLGQSDHLSLLLTPAYTPLKKTPPVTRTITTWPENALPELQDCFAQTEWSVFEDQDLAVQTEAVLDYIQFCTGAVTVDKRIRVWGNQKPWMDSQVVALLRARNTAFKSGDRDLYSAARADLRRGIRKAKDNYRPRIEDHLSTNNPRRVWQGIQQITNFRGQTNSSGSPSAALAEDLNEFFARFEVPPHLSAATPSLPPLPQPDPSHQPWTVQVHQVRRTLSEVNPRKASGPDGVPGKVLKACADQLAQVFTTIFNRSLTQATIPTSLPTGETD